MTTTDTYPMPDAACPRWCLEDHRPSWEDWVTAATDPTPIPAAGGGFLTGPGTPLDVWLSRWEPYHRLPVVRLDLSHHEAVEVDLVRTEGEPAHLYLVGDGAMTAEQARELSLALLDAAEALERAQA